MATKWLNRWRRGGAAAVLVGALLSALLVLDKSLPARDEAKATALPSDLAKVPSDGVFLLSVRIADLWDSELGKPVREKLAKDIGEGAEKFEKQFGLPLDRVERFSLVVMEAVGRADPLMFVHTSKALERPKALGGKNVKEEKYKEQTFYVASGESAVYPLDGQSLVYGSPDAIRALIDHPTPKAEGNLAPALRLAAGKHSVTAGTNVKAFNDAVGDKLPGEAAPFKPLLQASSGTLTVDLAERSRVNVHLSFPTEKDAKAGMEPAKTGLGLAGLALDQGVNELAKQKEMTKIVELLKQAQSALKEAKIEQQGNALRASVKIKIDVATVGVVMMEAVQKVRSAAARQQSVNNLKQIALAMHNYHDTFGNLPPHATYDKNGKALLSWRVLILPFIEQQNLYKQFHLDEPWDSDHNKKLLEKMPITYASPSDEKTAKDHTTHYQGFVGKGAFFEGKKGLRFADFTDGTSNTLMIVEATKAVPWSKPDDLPYDAAKPLPKLGVPGLKFWIGSMCDGSVRTFTNALTEKTLRDAITRNDGNVLGPDF